MPPVIFVLASVKFAIGKLILTSAVALFGASPIDLRHGRRPRIQLVRRLTATVAVVLGLVFLPIGTPARAQKPNSYMTTFVLADQSKVSLHVEDRGSGRPIVLLHGLGASSYMWRHLAPVLAKEHRVISVDLKGFGRSDKPVDFTYRIEDHVALVEALILELGLDDVTLIGHSLGGAIALLTAVQAQFVDDRRISRLILMNSPAFEQPPTLAVSLLRLPFLPYVILPILTPEFGARAILSPGGGVEVSRQDIAAYARPLRQPGALHALIETGRGIEPDNFKAVIARYSKLRQPSLIIWCRKDPTVPLAIGQRLSRTLPRAQLHILDTCRHVPPEQSIRETEQLVLSFLRSN